MYVHFIKNYLRKDDPEIDKSEVSSLVKGAFCVEKSKQMRFPLSKECLARLLQVIPW